MKKWIIALMVCIVMVFTMCGFNYQMFDFVYSFDYALVAMPNGECEKIAIQTWTDYEDGEQLQITAKDGTVYLVSSFNCVLVKES